MFGIADWMVLAAYFAVMAGIGIYFSRKNKNFSDFMFGGGTMPWMAVGISLIATSVSATTFLGNPAEAFARDMRLVMLSFGSILAIVVIAVVFIPRFRAAGISSAYELLEKRFSRPVRLLASTFYCCHLLLRTGILIYGPALVLARILGQPLWIAILAMTVVSVLYTYFGGIKAVTWTDVVQFGIFFFSGLAVIWFVADAVGSFQEIWQLAGKAGKTRWFDATPDPREARNLLSAGLVYAVFEIAIRGTDQQFVQRYLSCKSVREANYSSIASVVLGLCVAVIFFGVGASLYVYYQVRMVEMLPTMDVNAVFPHFILNTLPTGFKGLLVAAIMAAAMSSLSSAYTALSNTAVVDLLPGFRREEGQVGLRHAKHWVLVWGALSLVTAWIATLGDRSLLAKALFFTSLFIGPLLGLFLLAFFRSSTKPWAVFAGAILGMLSLIPISDLPFDLLNPLRLNYTFSWPWNPLISMSATILFAVVIDALIPRKVPYAALNPE